MVCLGGTFTTSGTVYATGGPGVIVNTQGICVQANNGLVCNSAGIFVQPGNSTIISNSMGVFANISTATGTVTSVGSGNGISGGPISASGTLYASAGPGCVVNTSGICVNSAYIATISANNASYLGGTAAASYALTSALSAYQTTAGMSSYATSSALTSGTLVPAAAGQINNGGYSWAFTWNGTSANLIVDGGDQGALLLSSGSGGTYNSGYTSGLPTGANVISFVHNLGVIPSRVTILFKCLTAENDWSVGDVIINPMREYTGGYANWVTTSNTTVLRWILYSSTGVYLSLDKSTGGAVQANPSNWAYSFIIAP